MPGITLRATVGLSSSGATSSSIDLHRDRVVIATAPNTGAYTDSIGVRGGNVRYTVRFGGPPLPKRGFKQADSINLAPRKRSRVLL